MALEDWNPLSTKIRGKNARIYGEHVLRLGFGCALSGAVLGLMLKRNPINYAFIGFALGAGYYHDDLKSLFRFRPSKS